MSEADTDLQWRIAALKRALGGKWPPKAAPPPEIVEEEQPTISRYEQLRAEELYEISLLPKPNTDPVIKAQRDAEVVALRAAEDARANRPIKINGVSRPMADFEDIRDIPFDNRKGQPAPLGINFVPFIALTKWCYTYAPPHLLQAFASAFFDADKIYARDWDL